MRNLAEAEPNCPGNLAVSKQSFANLQFELLQKSSILIAKIKITIGVWWSFMSSPLIKISDQSWSLCCLCCNCAQEVKDIVKMVVGPAFMEYNHRFTCPHCQTYNQILLTRDMFDNAQVMILPSQQAQQQQQLQQQAQQQQQQQIAPPEPQVQVPPPAPQIPSAPIFPTPPENSPFSFSDNPFGAPSPSQTETPFSSPLITDNPFAPPPVENTPFSFSTDAAPSQPASQTDSGAAPGVFPSFQFTPPSAPTPSTGGTSPLFEMTPPSPSPFAPPPDFSQPSPSPFSPPPVTPLPPPMTPPSEHDKFDPVMPAPKKDEPTRSGGPSFESADSGKPGKKESAKKDDWLDDDISSKSIVKDAAAGKVKAKGGKGAAAGESKLPSSINIGGKEIPVNNQTMAIGGGAAVLLVLVLYFTFFSGGTPPPAVATNPSPKPTAATGTPTPTPAPVTPSATPAPVVEAKMVEIPAGEYMMGNNDGNEYERPVHKVVVKSFLIDIREITREEYEAFIKATNRKPPRTWTNGKYTGNSKAPVTDIDWSDADAYAKWAGKRLPTEEEWEIAASGKEHFLYPWGNDWKVGYANTSEADRSGPMPAGTFEKGKNALGIYDMCGNVWEWTASKPVSYGGAAKIDNAEQYRVIRGGSFADGQKVATTMARNWVESNRADSRLGFRCAKDKE